MRKSGWVIIVVLAVGLMATAVAADEYGGAPPAEPMHMSMMVQPWTAYMTASQEARPCGSCLPWGSACFGLTPDGMGLNYTLEVDRLMYPTKAYIHMGLAHQNGPVVALLYYHCEPMPWAWNDLGDEGGYRVLAHGTIWAKDLRGPLEGLPITALVALFHSHDAYVGVHDAWRHEGVIRGQVW